MGKRKNRNSEQIKRSNQMRVRKAREKKKELLGESIDNVWYKLRKSILFDFVQMKMC